MALLTKIVTNVGRIVSFLAQFQYYNMSSALAQYSNVLDDDGNVVPIGLEVTRYLGVNGSLSQVTILATYNITLQNPLGT